MSYYIAEQIDLGIDKLIDGTADDSIVKLMKKIYKTDDSDVILQAVYLLYQICIEKKQYDLAKKIKSEIRAVKSCTYNNEISEIYNDEKKELSELAYINKIQYDFYFYEGRFNNNKYELYSEAYAFPLYHLVKTGCLKAVQAYLESASLFENSAEIMSYYIRISAKKHNEKMLKLFSERNYSLNAYDYAYLMLYDIKYLTDTVIPYFYSNYTGDAVKLYHELFTDNERLAVYIIFIKEKFFSADKMLFYRNNMLDISEIDIKEVYLISNSEKSFMMNSGTNQNDYIKDISVSKKLMLNTDCCAETVKVYSDNMFKTDTFENFQHLISKLFSPAVNLEIYQNCPEE